MATYNWTMGCVSLNKLTNVIGNLLTKTRVKNVCVRGYLLTISLLLLVILVFPVLSFLKQQPRRVLLVGPPLYLLRRGQMPSHQLLSVWTGRRSDSVIWHLFFLTNHTGCGGAAAVYSSCFFFVSLKVLAPGRARADQTASLANFFWSGVERSELVMLCSRLEWSCSAFWVSAEAISISSTSVLSLNLSTSRGGRHEQQRERLSLTRVPLMSADLSSDNSSRQRPTMLIYWWPTTSQSFSCVSLKVVLLAGFADETPKK